MGLRLLPSDRGGRALTLVAQHREHVFKRRQTFLDRRIGDFAGALVGNALLASTGLGSPLGLGISKRF